LLDTIFTDNNLTAGSHYFYRITAVDTEELESDYSDNVDAAIPVLTEIPNQVFNQGSSIQLILDNFVTDPDGEGDQITWEFNHSSHLNFELDADRNLTITSPDSSWLEEVILTATDEDEFYDQQRVWITVNDIPDIDELPDQLQQQGHPFSPIPLDDFVDDQDQADSLLVWEVGYVGDLHAELIDQHQLMVSHADNFTDKAFEEQWFGVENILLKVSDSFGASDSIRVKFDVNAKPQITSSPITLHQAQQEYRYPLQLTDPDSVETLTVDWLEFPEFLSVEASRSLRGTPDITQTGLYPIRVQVSDSRGGSILQEFTLEVQFTPGTPLLSPFQSQAIAEGGTFDPIVLNDYIMNMEEQDSIYWTATGQSDLTVEIDAAGTATIIIPHIDWFGKESITFRATNSNGLFTEQTIVFTVEAVNDAPYIAGLMGQKIYQNDQFAILDLNAFASDVDDEQSTLIWNISGNQNLDISTLGGNRFQITPKQNDWYGRESLECTVSDPQGLGDQVTAVFEIGKSIYSIFSRRFINSGTIIEIRWDTDLDAIGTIKFGTNNFDRMSDSEPRLVRSHSIILSGLEAHTDYQLIALSKDSSGYEHISEIYTFHTEQAGEVSVFPNPYKAGEYPQNDVIHFANLPAGANLAN